ncbi:MAG: DmsE family decaheme c-type cytochrome [Sideroxydans sp.]|nr:DmsE family decaheme c-type cytochrome [Sideroxydans sp.]
MKNFTKLLALCAFICGMGSTTGLLAADDKLPDMGASAGWSAEKSRQKDALCTRCHDESEPTPILALYQNKHGVRGDIRTPNCQTCHGESEKHLKGDPNVKGRAAPDILFKKGTFEASDSKVRAGQCLSCHKDNRRGNWDGGQHDNNQVACNDCHKVHTKADKVLSKKTQTEVCFTCHKEQRADSLKASTHPINANKVVCSDCHNPHGSAGPKLLKKATVTETCYTCHAEKRGPFLFEHQPVTEDCANCHTPHGSNIFPLLKSRAPFLCSECHDGTHASGTPTGPNAGSYPGGLAPIKADGTTVNAPSANVTGRACMNCHRQVHGSNSPAGGYLQR